MKRILLCENIAVVHILHIGVYELGNTADFLFLAVDEDRLARSAVLLGTDIEILIIITDFKTDHLAGGTCFADLEQGVLADEVLVPVDVLLEADLEGVGVGEVAHVVEAGFGGKRPCEHLELGDFFSAELPSQRVVDGLLHSHR